MVVGHGQMTEDGAREGHARLHGGPECDVLVATTIVENGLDIPTPTRSSSTGPTPSASASSTSCAAAWAAVDVPAYAYLLIPPKHEISEDARKRLQALEDFSELGSGFRVAAMDLELRGAGNLLGGEQSGHIHDIGFELYVKLLEETLSELQGQPSSAFEVKVDGLAPGAQLGRRWIDQAAERLVAYKRISRLREEKDLELYRMDLEDRFGHVPEDDPTPSASSNCSR